MSFFHGLRGTTRQRGKVRCTPRLRVEVLEDRCTPTAGLSASLVADIVPGAASSAPFVLQNVNGTLYFGAVDPTSGTAGVYKSDGTAAGTVFLTGGIGSLPTFDFTPLNGSVLFRTSGGPGNTEGLWKTNGTPGGTTVLKALSINELGYRSLTASNGKVFFNGSDGTSGTELWMSDGTAAGTVMVKDIYSGSTSYKSVFYDENGKRHVANNKVINGSGPAWLTDFNGTLFFAATDGTNGRELWKSDGTAAGTVLVKDINPGLAGSNPEGLIVVNGTLFFAASGGLWKSDGTAAGTVLVRPIVPGELTNVNGTLFFTANDGVHGTELWKSDGTAAGTVLVSDIQPGSNGSAPQYLTNVNGTLFFSAVDGAGGYGLWKSDGSASGTTPVKAVQAIQLTNVNGRLYFDGYDEHGWELWQSDGTAAGTVMVQDIFPGTDSNGFPNSSFPYWLVAMNNKLYFSATDPVHGRELWDPPPVEPPASGSIAGALSEDLTGNGVSVDDPPVAGRAVNLFRDDGDGTFEPGMDANVAQVQTRSDGSYDFRLLEAGVYFVQQVLPLDWVQTEPAGERIDVIVLPADCGPAPRERNDTLTTAVATGLSSAAPGRYTARGEIGDNNYQELDVDLFRVQVNAGDVIRVDVDAEAFDSSLDATLRLFDAAGIQMACSTDVGDSSDPYLELIAKTTGTYYVGVSGHANADYDPALAGSGTLAFSTGEYTLEIEVGPRPGAQPVVVTLAAGETRTGVDLTSSRLGSITGRMFEDLDGDGAPDADEPGLDGWRVTLLHAGGLFSVTTTRSIDLNHDGRIDPATESGLYSFTDLRPGTYFLRGLISIGFGPPGWTQVSPELDLSVQPRVGEVSSGPGSDPGPGLEPDLTVDLANGLWDRFQFGNELHFAQATPNIGLGPMELRAGADLGNGTQIVNQRIYLDPSLTTYVEREAGTFTFHPEHNHIHFDDYAVYSLRQALPDNNGDGLPEVGAVVAGGQKTSFCLVDVAPFDLTLPNAAQEPSGFGCGTVQRISVGWEDIYDALTIGQQIDVSGLAPGQYWLEAVVDPDNRLLESNENNNTGRALVSVGLGGPDAPFGAHGVQLRSGQVVTGKDFANFRTISISGQVFNDKNANGRQDNKEHGLDGWTVFIDLNGDGVLNNPEGNGLPTALAKEPWAITDNQGNYVFAGRGPGACRLLVVPRAGWTQMTPNPAPFGARSGQNVPGVNFGLIQASALTAEETGGGAAAALTMDQVTSLLAQALARWQAAGADTSAMGAVDVRVRDLGGATLGLASGNTIWLDDNAASWGWFVDKTPWDDSEFLTPGDQGEQKRMDLLTALEHELGHVLGYEHENDGVIMAETLAAGTRPGVNSTWLTNEPLLSTDAFFAMLAADEEIPGLGGKQKKK